jgi:hypothetical protein
MGKGEMIVPDMYRLQFSDNRTILSIDTSRVRMYAETSPGLFLRDERMVFKHPGIPMPCSEK